MGEMAKQLAMQEVIEVVNKLLRNTFLSGATWALPLKRELCSVSRSSGNCRHRPTGSSWLIQSSP